MLAAITISKILAGIFALAGTAGIYRMYRNAADTPIGKKEGEEAEETVEEQHDLGCGQGRQGDEDEEGDHSHHPGEQRHASEGHSLAA